MKIITISSTIFNCYWYLLTLFEHFPWLHYRPLSTMSSVSLKRITLKSAIDQGLPDAGHFNVEEHNFDLEEAKTSIKEGEVLISVKAISADPYLRLGVKTGSSGLGAVSPGEVMKGFVVGEVIASNHGEWNIGEILGSELPFVNFQALSDEQLSNHHVYRLTDYVNQSNLTYGLGILGMPGATAYGGLIDILQPQQGETIFISAASGTVGGIVGMLAKQLFHCTVIGSCRGQEKCDFITSQYNYDHAIDIATVSNKEDLVQQLLTFAPEGIDMYFENVGGFQFEAALEVLRPRGRIALCGWISGYNDVNYNPVTMNPSVMIFKQQKMEGFLSLPWLFGERGNFLPDMHRWLQEGKVKVEETVFQGIENWPMAFQSLFTGKKKGKVVVVL